MTKTNKYKTGIIGIITLAKAINPKIGTYQEHYVNENFELTIKLTNNGTIVMPSEIARDYEIQPRSVTYGRIVKVANSYKIIE